MLQPKKFPKFGVVLAAGNNSSASVAGSLAHRGALALMSRPQMASVKVAVRVRPFNQREIDRGATNIIQMQGDTTRITNPTTFKHNTFTFDYSFWSFAKDEQFAAQEKVYNAVGREMMSHAFDGFARMAAQLAADAQ